MLANEAQAGLSRDGAMAPQQHQHNHAVLQRCSEAGRAPLDSSGVGPCALASPACLERVSHAAPAAGQSGNSQLTMQPCMRMRLCGTSRQPQRRSAMGVLLQVAMLLQLVLLLQPGACQAQLQQQGEVIDTDYNILNQPFPTGLDINAAIVTNMVYQQALMYPVPTFLPAIYRAPLSPGPGLVLANSSIFTLCTTLQAYVQYVQVNAPRSFTVIPESRPGLFTSALRMNTFSTSYMGNAIALLNVTISCYATADFTTATAVVASGTELESAVALITNLRLQGTIRLDASVSTAGWSKTIYSPSAPLTIQGPTDRSVVLDFGMLAFIISMSNYPIHVENLVLVNMCSQLVPMPVPDYVAYLSYLVFAFTHSAWDTVNTFLTNVTMLVPSAEIDVHSYWLTALVLGDAYAPFNVTYSQPFAVSYHAFPTFVLPDERTVVLLSFNAVNSLYLNVTLVRVDNQVPTMPFTLLPPTQCVYGLRNPSPLPAGTELMTPGLAPLYRVTDPLDLPDQARAMEAFAQDPNAAADGVYGTDDGGPMYIAPALMLHTNVSLASMVAEPPPPAGVILSAEGGGGALWPGSGEGGGINATLPGNSSENSTEPGMAEGSPSPIEGVVVLSPTVTVMDGAPGNRISSSPPGGSSGPPEGSSGAASGPPEAGAGSGSIAGGGSSGGSGGSGSVSAGSTNSSTATAGGGSGGSSDGGVAVVARVTGLRRIASADTNADTLAEQIELDRNASSSVSTYTQPLVLDRDAIITGPECAAAAALPRFFRPPPRPPMPGQSGPQPGGLPGGPPGGLPGGPPGGPPDGQPDDDPPPGDVVGNPCGVMFDLAYLRSAFLLPANASSVLYLQHVTLTRLPDGDGSDGDEDNIPGYSTPPPLPPGANADGNSSALLDGGNQTNGDGGVGNGNQTSGGGGVAPAPGVGLRLKAMSNSSLGLNVSRNASNATDYDGQPPLPSNPFLLWSFAFRRPRVANASQELEARVVLNRVTIMLPPTSFAPLFALATNGGLRRLAEARAQYRNNTALFDPVIDGITTFHVTMINTTGIYVPYYAGWGIYGSNLVIMSTEGSPELPFPDSRPHIPPASPAPRSPSPPGRGLSPPTHSLVPSPSPGNKQTDGQAAVPPVGGGTSKSVEGSLSQGAAVAIAVCVAVAAVAAAVGGLLWFLGERRRRQPRYMDGLEAGAPKKDAPASGPPPGKPLDGSVSHSSRPHQAGGRCGTETSGDTAAFSDGAELGLGLCVASAGVTAAGAAGAGGQDKAGSDASLRKKSSAAEAEGGAGKGGGGFISTGSGQPQGASSGQGSSSERLVQAGRGAGSGSAHGCSSEALAKAGSGAAVAAAQVASSASGPSGTATEASTSGPVPRLVHTNSSTTFRDPLQAVLHLASTVTGGDSATATQLGFGLGLGDRLELLEPIGTGGFGTVYHGRWRNLDVAVKTVLFTNTGSGARTSAEAAIREAAVCSSVVHPYVISTYYYDIKPVELEGKTSGLQIDSQACGTDWKLFLVQELCEANLADVIEASMIHDHATGLPKLPLVLTLLSQVADGMQYIHSKSIIHGDLKPENVLLKHDSASPPPCVVSKITDFGLCTTMDPGKTHISGFTNGTPFYMAPEIALSRKGTPSSDVYSFGVLMVEVYTGSPPWVRNGNGYAANRNFLKFKPGTPRRFAQLAMRCLDPKPRLRPTFSEVTAVLQDMRACLRAGFVMLERPSLPPHLHAHPHGPGLSHHAPHGGLPQVPQLQAPGQAAASSARGNSPSPAAASAAVAAAAAVAADWLARPTAPGQPNGQPHGQVAAAAPAAAQGQGSHPRQQPGQGQDMHPQQLAPGQGQAIQGQGQEIQGQPGQPPLGTGAVKPTLQLPSAAPAALDRGTGPGTRAEPALQNLGATDATTTHAASAPLAAAAASGHSGPSSSQSGATGARSSHTGSLDAVVEQPAQPQQRQGSHQHHHTLGLVAEEGEGLLEPSVAYEEVGQMPAGPLRLLLHGPRHGSGQSTQGSGQGSMQGPPSCTIEVQPADPDPVQVEEVEEVAVAMLRPRLSLPEAARAMLRPRLSAPGPAGAHDRSAAAATAVAYAVAQTQVESQAHGVEAPGHELLAHGGELGGALVELPLVPLLLDEARPVTREELASVRGSRHQASVAAREQRQERRRQKRAAAAVAAAAEEEEHGADHPDGIALGLGHVLGRDSDEEVVNELGTK